VTTITSIALLFDDHFCSLTIMILFKHHVRLNFYSRNFLKIQSMNTHLWFLDQVRFLPYIRKRIFERLQSSVDLDSRI